jgi:hypothetical protein
LIDDFAEEKASARLKERERKRDSWNREDLKAGGAEAHQH